jgi:hypothetical protein
VDWRNTFNKGEKDRKVKNEMGDRHSLKEIEDRN